MHCVKTALLCGVFSVALTETTQAQNFNLSGDFGRVISFGDSYSDTGNRIALSPVALPFFLPGRITNGPVFTELLAGGQDSMLRPATDPAFQANPQIFSKPLTTGNVATILGADDPRLATFTNTLNADRGTTFTPQDIVDGAIDEPGLTGSLVSVLEPDDIYDLERTMDLNSGVFATSNLNLAVAGAESLRNVGAVPSTRQQVEFYFANGGTFNDSDLITFLSGANDNSQLGFVDATVLGQQVANENIAVLDLIAQNGSGTVAVVGLADLSLVPGGRNQPALIQEVARNFSSSVIDRQFSELQRLAREYPDVNFVYVDLLALQTMVEANPDHFGFSNITDACIADGQLCDDPDSYFFIDSIHPTKTGHELLANLVAAHVAAGHSARNTYVLDEMALTSRSAATQGMFDRLNRLNAQEGSFAVFLEGYGNSVDRDSDGTILGYTSDLSGLRIGAEGRFDNGFAAGVALGLAQGDADQPVVDFDYGSVQIDFYGRYEFGGKFIDLTLGYDDIDYDDVQRALSVGPLVNTGATDGRSFSLAGRAGHRFELQKATLTPALKLAYYNTKVDGFTEDGTLARIDYDSRSGDYLVGGLELLAEFQASQSVRLFTSVGYDFLLDGNQPDITGRLAGNTAQPFSTRAGDPEIDGLDLSVGVSASFGAGFVGTAQVEWRGQFSGSDSGRFIFGINKAL